MFSPLEQFELNVLGYVYNKYDILHVSNENIIMIVLLLSIILLFLKNYTNNNTTNNFIISTMLLKFVANLIYNTVGKLGQQYFLYLFTIFIFILGANLIGMIPFTFTITSHLIITLTLSFVSFIGLNIVGLQKHSFHFFELFLPKGAPLAMSPFLIVIEIISYIARLFSLAIRLFANMMSGHSLLKILAGFSYVLLLNNNLIYLSIFPYIIVFMIIYLEIGIAALQAYVFLVLLIIYLNDVIFLH